MSTHTTHTTPTTPSNHVLIVGAGFAGGMAAVRLAGRSRGRVRITVVNPRPTFVNRLRLHQVATGRRVSAPGILRMLGSDVTFVEGWVTALDADAGRATVSGPDGSRTIGFDRVVLATGSTTEPVPVPGGEHAHGVADLESAERLRHAFARLPAGADVTVVGGGFTGLETVGELAGSRPDLMVRLVTSGEVGGWFGTKAADHVRASLRRLGVEALGGARVQALERDRLTLDDGAEVPSDLTVWCGGFAAPPLARESGLAVDRAGAVLTDDALQSVSHPQVLAVGDTGHTVAPHGGRYSMSCQFAFPSGAHAADVLSAEALGTAPHGGAAPLDLGFQGRCVSIGGQAAVLQLTDRDDVATDRALTGRGAVAAKRFQVRGVVSAIGFARRAPGAIRWPGSGRTPSPVQASVAG
ncbi:FAD-dependent oxidoreductase [Isoptericola halotolerans]|uniref:NAD(P)/FAD-dependent oxidoreductase n=1 Tax=Isoptericola halotolerans TaxID=300560 RepID=UPI00388EFB37